MKKAKIVSVLMSAFLLVGCNSTTTPAESTDPITSTGPNSTDTTPEPVKNEVLSFSVNSSYKAYKNSLILDEVDNLKASGKDLAHTGFFKNAEGGKDTYKVGSANALKVRCTGSYLDSNGQLETATIDKIDHKLELKNETGEYVDVTSEEGTYVSVLENDYDFTDAAIGHEFRLTLSPDSETYSSDKSDTMEFEVVDGWNAYTAADLAYIDNTHPDSALISADDKSKYQIFDSFADVRDVHIAETIKAVVLQNDITITNDDVPEIKKWSATDVTNYEANYSDDFQTWCKNNWKTKEDGSTRTDEECYTLGREKLLGSFKDFTVLYSRGTNEDETFTLEGNYYTIDTTGIKKIVKFRDKSLVNAASSNGSHSELFGFPGDGGFGYEHDGYMVPFQFRTFNGPTYLKNANVKGNAPRADASENLGGLITIKQSSTDFKAVNFNSSDTFITFFPRPDDDYVKLAKTELDRCRWYDSYSSMLFLYGTLDNKITNSVMIGAGGSLMLLAEPYAADGNKTKHQGSAAQIENSYLESFVNGQESWFVDKGASSYIPMLAQYQKDILNKLKADFNTTSSFVKTIDNVDYVNMIAITLDSESPFGNTIASGDALKCKVDIDSKNIMNFADLSTGDMAPLALTMAGMKQQGLLFKTSEGGKAAAGATDGSELLAYSSTFAALPSANHDAVVNQFKTKDPTLGALANANMFPASQHTTIAGAFNANSLGDVANELEGNWKNMVSGEYMSLYLQPATTINYVGMIVGYDC